MEPVQSVYVHSPFCRRRCHYCDFAVTVSRDPDPRAWLEAVAWELELLEKEGLFALEGELRTLFVGGGTPSLMGPGAMAGLAGVLGAHRVGHPDLEWTAEANPESFTEEVAGAWAAAGVNRISLGVQSFQAPVLQWLNRLHGPEEPVHAVHRARQAGIRNLNLDLIFGLPTEVERSWEKDLDAVLAMEVPHISLYGLSVEPGTPLSRAMETGRVSRPEDEEYCHQFLTASERLVAEGYTHYEVSNFARPGFEARHNRVYWDHVPYLGLGNSAHSFREGMRRWNLRDWNAYQKAYREGGSPWAAEERLSPRQVRLERLWLGLRTNRGLAGEDLSSRSEALVQEWLREGLATRLENVVRLTPRGWLLLDHLVVALQALQDPSDAT